MGLPDLSYDPALIEEYTRAGWWDDRTLDDVFRANVAERGDVVALIDPPNRADLFRGAPRTLTWASLDAEVDLMAARLLSCGLKQGDVLIYQMPNVSDLVVLFLACVRLGVVVSPAPMQYGRHEVRSMLRQLGGAAAIVVSTPFRGEARDQAIADMLGDEWPDVAVLTLGPATAGRARSLDDVAVENPSQTVRAYSAAHPVSADDILTLCWTSGTTADAKGVPRTHNNWKWHGLAMSEAGGCGRGEVFLNPFPAVNHGGIGSGVLPWLMMASTAVLHHPFDLEMFLKQIQDHRVETTVAAPAVLSMVLKAEDLTARYDLSSLKRIIAGGAPMPGWVITAFRERFGVDVVNMLGSNEGTSLMADPRDLGDDEKRATCFFRIGAEGYDWPYSFAPSVQTRLVDPETGEEIIGPGRPGELRIRSPSIFAGYLGRPRPDLETFDEQGYFRTGDTLEIVEDGHGGLGQYRFVGRSKDLVIRGGQNIAPAEIEALIEGMAACAEVAVLGYPDEAMGERVCACVVPRSGQSLTLADIQAHMAAGGVAKWKWPERLELMDALPRNPMNKVLKRQLAQMFI